MLKKGICVIFKANVISLVFNLLTSFLLPKYLSVEAYAAIKTFQLYTTYVGLLHLGYADGMYLRYGGSNISEIDGSSLRIDVHTVVVFQLGVSIISIFASLALKDVIWLAFSASIFPLNIASYYKLLFQATGEFDKYGKITNITTFITFLANVVLLFALNCRNNGMLYIVFYVLADFIVLIILERSIQKEFSLKKYHASFDLKILVSNVKDGILLMLGNLSTAIFTGMDRWFVKFLLDTVSFAQYSFAVSIENFLNVAVTPISVTLYNYFCTHKSKEEQLRLLRYIMIFGSILPICLFPAKFILEHYLTHYLDAANIIVFLFAAQSYAIVNKCIYINLYKAQRKQMRYFSKLIVAIGAGFAFNVLFYILLKEKVAFAIGTMFSNILWFVLSVLDFPELKISAKEYIYLTLESLMLIAFGNFMNSILGFLAFSIGTGIATWIFMNESVRQIVKMFTIKLHA